MPVRSALKLCSRTLSWAPVMILTLVVLWSYYAYVVQLCLITLTGTARKVTHLLTFHICFGMFSWAFWRSAFTAPTTPSKQFHLSASDRQRYSEQNTAEAKRQVLLEIARKLPIHARTASGAIRFCRHCQLIKPDRCHHCSACQMCVLKMDHHCPWLNNCVGYSNYKFFLLFLAFSLLYCLFIVATVTPYFIKFWLGQFLNYSAVKVHVLFLMLVSLMFSITLAFLLCFHCWLVSKNKTTVEWLSAPFFSYGPDGEVFDVGCSRNVSQVFGLQRKLWLLPIFSSSGDGQNFPLKLRSHNDSEQVISDETEKHAENLLSWGSTDCLWKSPPSGSTADLHLEVEF